MQFSNRGCQPCKSRRKKCDGTVPVCLRCTKARRVCFGLQAAFSTVHIENAFANGQVKRPRGPRSRLEASKILTVVPSRDIRTEAIAYYMHQHLELVKGASNLIDSPRESLLSTWSSSPAVDLAVTSIALALFSKTKQCPAAATQSLINYRESLKSLQGLLNTLCTDNIDACLLTTCLLSRYEDAILPNHMDVNTLASEMHKGRSHYVGILAVLDYWKQIPHLTQNPTRTVQYARRMVRKAALFGRIDLPDWLLDGHQFGECGYEEALDDIITRMIQLRSTFSCLSQLDGVAELPKELFLPSVQAFLVDVRKLDQTLVNWIEDFPGRKKRTQHDLTEDSSSPNRRFYRSVMYSYPNHAYAAVRAQYCSYRLLIKKLELQALEVRDSLVKATNPQERQECLKEVGGLANELASTIPFCLERFTLQNENVVSDGSGIRAVNHESRRPYISELAVGPMLLASAMPHLSPELREWFRVQLVDVGRLLGYGILEIIATTDLLKL